MYVLGVEAFLAVVRAQNVSRAAEQLNLTQSALSKRLRVLEQEIGSVLIERGKGLRMVRLTPAGTAFIDLAERWENVWRETQRLKSHGPQLALSIGTTDSLNYAVFPSLYRALDEHRPKISLRVITSHSQNLYDAVEGRQVDIAFVLRERAQPNVVIEKCYTEPLVGLQIAAIGRHDFKVVHSRELDPNYELYVRWGPSYELWHDSIWDPLCPGRTWLDTAQLVLSFLSKANQWAIVPQSVATTALTTGNFRIFQLAEAPPERVFYKLTHKYPKASAMESMAIFDQYLAILLQKEFSQSATQTRNG
ncbi:MAG: LysR family transcriptional regulator [Negativicutes bacterium]|nr:LysR family transcriptional regulator [Negativicutes bacterium]